jgi:hypothetical protein
MANLRLAVAEGDPSSVQYAGWKLVEDVWECLALANQVFFERGPARSLSAADRFRERPKGLKQLVAIITTSPDSRRVLRASEQLAQNTRQVLRRIQSTIPSDTTHRKQFRQCYPEIRDDLGKLLSACERRDRVAASAQAWLLQSEVTLMLSQATEGLAHGDFNLYCEFGLPYRELGLPDLVQFARQDLEALAEQSRLFDSKLRNFLEDQSVDLCEFDTSDELRDFLKHGR